MCDRESSLGFGERMQREREMRGITLDEIANATKIGSRTLRALEEEDFSKLPGGIFNKGFVRAYARYLGIDEEQAVADYMAAMEEPKPGDASDSSTPKRNEAKWKPPKLEVSSPDFRALPWKPLFLLVLMLAGIFGVWHLRHAALDHFRHWEAQWRRPRQQTIVVTPAAPAMPSPAATMETAPAAPSVSAVSAAPSPAAASSSPEASLPAEAPSPQPGAAQESANSPSGEFVVMFHAREDSWVSITADGKPIMKGTLIARRETTVRAKQRITMLAGNAAGIEFSFNGQPQVVLGGKSNEVRTIVFTPEGLQPQP
jgi:cytoskeleton protein RodZ